MLERKKTRHPISFSSLNFRIKSLKPGSKFFLALVLTLSSSWLFAEASVQLPDTASAVCPIKVGETLPPLLLQGLDGKDVNLGESVAGQPSILIFYRGSWCPYCNVHLGELKTIEAELKQLGYAIIAVSPDLPANLKKSVDKNKLDYRLLSDSKATAAKALGLAYRVDDALYQKLLGYEINLEAASGEQHHILPVPAAIVLDKKGTVKFVFASPDYKVRVDTELLLAAAKSALKK